MPQLMTYNSLLANIRSYIERGYSQADPIVFEQLPFLVQLAERRIARDIKVQGFQNVVETQLQVNLPVYPKPDRWRETLSMNIVVSGQRRPLLTRSYEYLRAMFPDESALATPLFYADYDYYRWLILPSPDQTYSMEVIYNEIPALLDESNQQNWITDFAPNLLLYACLLEVAPFLKNDERIGVWQSYYDRILGALNQEDMQKIIDRGAVRNEV